VKPEEDAKVESDAAPTPADQVAPELARRDLMRLLAASAALAALPACAQRPREKILPHGAGPADVRRGVPLYYATSMELDGLALGLLAKSTDGRPTKLEGNPEHPASLGATRVYEQAAVLDLYDPTRLDGARHAANPVSMDNALAAVARAAGGAKRPWFLLPPQSSPTLGALVNRIRERTRGARFTFRSAVGRSSVHAATRAVFERPLEVDYDFRRARVVLALDADFLGAAAASLAWARAWAERRRQLDSAGAMSRLYVAETMPSPTGSVADHRFPVRPSELGELASALCSLLARSPAAQMPDDARAVAAAGVSAFRAPWLAGLAQDLSSARGESIVLAGEQQAPEIHILAVLLNAALGNLHFGLRELAEVDRVESQAHAPDADAGIGAREAYAAQVLLGNLLARDQNFLHI
jgi:molybdopterin-containing oxidoreductase family iron-sulfur binding subunit